jgi:hypothetical protein
MTAFAKTDRGLPIIRHRRFGASPRPGTPKSISSISREAGTGIHYDTANLTLIAECQTSSSERRNGCAALTRKRPKIAETREDPEDLRNAKQDFAKSQPTQIHKT